MRVQDFTREWWEKKLVKGLEEWLIRLWATEDNAADRFQLALTTWCPKTNRERDVFVQIMNDERRHSKMVERVMLARNIKFPERPSIGRERYWEEVWPHVTGFPLACAALALGETLAIVRFRVIAAHPLTPDYIRSLIEEIIPDETRHIEQLSMLAGSECLQKMKRYHRLGMKALNIS